MYQGQVPEAKNLTAAGKSEIGIGNFLDIVSDFRYILEYGKIRTELKRKEAPIGSMALLIAGHARAEGLILVTNNTREFCRVERLVVEDWTRDQANTYRCRHRDMNKKTNRGCAGSDMEKASL